MGSGGKEDAAEDHSYHAYTYIIAFTYFCHLVVLSVKCPGALWITCIWLDMYMDDMYMYCDNAVQYNILHIII